MPFNLLSVTGLERIVVQGLPRMNKGTSKSLNHLVNTKLHKPSTSYTVETNTEQTDKDDETEDPKKEGLEHRDDCRNKDPNLLPSISTQEVLSPIWTKTGKDQRIER